MNPEQAYWEARWREGRIGFHEGRVNEPLQKFWPELGLRGDEAVLVPLCGKAQDLRWLAERGHRVVGVEFSAEAVAAFFREQNLAPERRSDGGFAIWSAESLTILQGDFFDLRPEWLAGLCGGALPRAWWDRAALVALAPGARRQYALRMAELLAPGARGLLLAFEYRQEQMQGPPYAVAEAEVRAQFGPPAFAEPRLLQRSEVELTAERRALGVTRLQDVLWRLERTAGVA